ncbi:MAG: cysteine desulfurase [Bacteroidia bacterium]|nr:MAG: cysteine desulfurase [Bacteroidia bacterium]
MEKKIIYLDHAASTPQEPEVTEVMTECMAGLYGNPSSVHEAGRRARIAIEQARRTVAGHLNLSTSEIFFTSGGTEANNAILWSCARDLGHRHFITSELEHPAVLKPLEVLREMLHVNIHLVKVDLQGHVDLQHLESLLDKYSSAVVSLMHANNEIGNLLPVKNVADLCNSYGALFHSDTVQTVGKFAMDIPRLGLDFAAASAHKFHGPKGAGFMVIRKGRTLEPLLSGGGQERNMRAGTENVCGIVGLAKALELAMQRVDEDQQDIAALKSQCMEMLRAEIPGVEFNGDAEGKSLHTILNFSLPPGMDANMLLPQLDIEGICVSSGSACASGAAKGSHVLKAMGVDPGKPSVRVSFSRHTTGEEIIQLVQSLKKIS